MTRLLTTERVGVLPRARSVCLQKRPGRGRVLSLLGCLGGGRFLRYDRSAAAARAGCASSRFFRAPAITQISRYNQGPVFAPDGKQVLFLAGTKWNADSRPIFSLWSVDTDGKNPI